MAYPRRRLRFGRVLLFAACLLLVLVYAWSLRPLDLLQVGVRDVKEGLSRKQGQAGPPAVLTVNRTDIETCVYVDKPEPVPTEAPSTGNPGSTLCVTPLVPSQEAVPCVKGQFPVDLFPLEQRRSGWVTLHLFGMVYMFVALAIVCDEFFVPALEAITETLQISDDVAGATFMAAGGSAPELFTSLIGVFIARSNVGIGTIVGSAVFNILFVIGMCAIFSREMLHLTWWPLFRDVSFYILYLMMLIVFFLDNAIRWWESTLLVSGYISYVTFMKFNAQIEAVVKRGCGRHKGTVQVWSAQQPDKVSAAPPALSAPAPKARSILETKPTPDPKPEDKLEIKPTPTSLEAAVSLFQVRPVLQRGGSTASLHNVSIRSTIFQLMIHTLDPLTEDGEQKLRECDPTGAEPSTSQKPDDKLPEKTQSQESERSSGSGSGSSSSSSSDEAGGEDEEAEEEEEEESAPLSLDWPQTCPKRVSYLLLLPIVFPLWVTLPDVRNADSRRFFPMTFLGSILWIGIFSYLMVWWAHQVGETIGISEEIMGLTILAAGTSIPDLITSVIVARKGLGDMAVSSSVGSNIFDITVGLPVPWLLFSLSHGGEPVRVSSNGLFCAIVLLFLMLLFVIASIAVCRWKMSRNLGLTMFLLYFMFLLLSVLLENRIITCPVSV
uniref:Sodium/potassium/calcium exchanger 1 n=1 Tax=Neogobius melanostomus TaxID=47308 RepID=A0A8C6V390_9GOBI